MKTLFVIAAIFGALLASGWTDAQEGNEAVRDILENKDLQDMLRDAKNNPEAAAEAIKSNPEELIRNATAVFADKQAKKDPTAVPATKNSKSQSDKALQQMRKMFSKPAASPKSSEPSAQTKDQLKDTAVEAMRKMRFNTNKLKDAADKALGTNSPATAPNDPPNSPARMNIEPIPSVRPVQPAPSMAESPVDTSNRVSVPQSAPLPMRNMEPTSPQIPDSPELNAAAVPSPQPLEPRYPKPKKFRPTPDPQDSESEDTMVITANESEMDNNKHTLTFRGDVLVEMKDMELTCDNLIVFMDSKNEMQRTVATGGLVQVRRIGAGGKLQISKSQRAEHIAATETTILTGGPPFLQDGDRYVNTDSADSKIILGGDGKYKVFSPDSPGRSVIVVPISNGKGITDGIGLDKKLKNLGR